MNFEDFLEWLRMNCMEPRTTITLGERSSFRAIIGIDGRSLIIEYGSEGNSGNLSENELLSIWERYWNLPDDLKHRTNQYNEPIWPERSHRHHDPYVPALIRDFVNAH